VFTPSILLHNYFQDLSFLPFRQITLFAASVFPGAFSLRNVFDPIQYAREHSDQSKDTRNALSAAELRAERDAFMKIPHTSRLPPTLAAIINADNRLYLERIARLASVHGTKLMLLYLPAFESGPLDKEIVT
jgi:hypothetical protein